jgi:lipid II isoglutaminyl synthase (glutamine-hydrolysing)
MTATPAGAAMSANPGAPDHVVIAHLFPDALNLYGDRGNILSLVRRAGWRGIDAEVRGIGAGDGASLAGVDVIFIGGGADQHQRAVADALIELADPLRRAIDDGAALLAVCAGYQNLGHAFRSPLVGEIPGPGLLDVETEMPAGAERFVGGIALEVDAGSPIAGADPNGRRRIVGFENHSGRTTIGPTMRPLGRVVFGRGNDGTSGFEGAVALAGEGGMRGLRIGTYLHGPLLPRNPHLADFVLASGLGRGPAIGLPPLPDDLEWDAHRRFAADWTAIRPGIYRRSRIGRLRDRMGALIGF